MNTLSTLLESVSNPRKCDATWLRKIQALLCSPSTLSKGTHTGATGDGLLMHAKSAMKLLNLVNQTLVVDKHKIEVLQFTNEGNILLAAISALNVVEKAESLLKLNPFDFEKAASGIVSRAIIYNEVNLS
jgi:hypothetical protein